MKLRLPNKLQAALIAAIASVSFTTLSTGTIAVATGAALLAGQQAQADEVLLTSTFSQSGTSGGQWTATSSTSYALTTSTWKLTKVNETGDLGNKSASNQLRPDVNVQNPGPGWVLSFDVTNTGTDEVTLTGITINSFLFNGSNGYQGNTTERKFDISLADGDFLDEYTITSNGNSNPESGIITLNFNEAVTLGKDGSKHISLTVAKGNEGLGCFVGLTGLAVNGSVSLPGYTWNGDAEHHDWHDEVWNSGVAFVPNSDAIFGSTGYQVVTVSDNQAVHNITISDKAYTFEGSGTLTVAGAVTVNSGASLVLNSAATAQAMLPKVAGEGNVTLNAVAELGSGVATTGTGELTINSTRGSGAYDLKLSGGNGATHDFSHFSKVNLAEGVVIEYDAGQTTLNNVTLLGDASFSMYDMGVAGNGIWLKGATALGSHTLAFNNKSNSSSWKRKVTIDQLTGDATSKLQFLGGATGDGVGSKLYVNSLQGFSGTLHLEEKNTGNAVEATVKTGTGSAVKIAGVEFAGTGELLDLTAQTALNLGTVTVADNSEIKFHGTPSQQITIEKLAGNATGKTLKIYSADQTTSAHHIVLGAAEGVSYAENLYNGTLWVTSNSNQGGSATSTVDAYIAAQDVLSATTLKMDNWANNYNNTRISLSLGTDAKVVGINSANTGAYAGWGAYIRSGELTVAQPNGVNDFVSTSESAYTLEITGAGTYTSNAYIMGNVNLAMSGAGSQTFRGDVTRFNGTITTTAGTLAFTNAVSAAALNGTGGTLQANGGLTVGGGTYAGTLTTSALTVNTGTLTFNGGTIDTATLSAGTGTLAINPGTSAAVTFNGTLTNAGNITLDGEGEIHIANISNFDVQKEGTEFTYSGAAGTKYAGSGFITGSNTQYYLIKGNGGTLTGNIAIQGGTRVTEEVADTDYVFTVSGSTPLGTEYYVNSNLSYLNNDKDAGMDTATGFTVKEGVTFTTTGEIIHNRSMVLNEGSTLNTTATSYFDRAQINSLTLNGDATVAVAGGRIALQTGTDYRDVTLQLNGNTLTVRGNSGGYFGIVGNTTVDRGTIALQGPKFMLGHSSKGGLTANAPDTLLTLTNGSSLVPANGNRFILEGLQMAAGDTGSASIASDGATGNLTLSPDAGKSYTYKGSVKLVDLTLDGPGTQVMNVTSYDTALTSLHVNQGTLKLTGADVTTGTLAGAGSLSVAGTLTVNNGSANDFTGTLALGGLTKTGAGALTIHGVAGIGSTVQVSAGSLALAAGTYDLSGITPTSSTPVVGQESGYADLTASVRFINGSFTTAESGVTFIYNSITATEPISDDGTVNFSGKDYATYYLVNAGDELDLTTEMGTNPLLKAVELRAASGTISLDDERTLTTLTQADSSTLTLAGGGSLTVGAISNNAAIAFTEDTSLTSSQAEMIVGGGKTFTTSGEGTLHLQTLRVDGNGAKVTLGAATVANSITTGAGTLDINADATLNALQIGLYNAVSTVNIGQDATVHVTGTTVSDSGGAGGASFMVSNYPQANILNIDGHLIAEAGISSRDGSANINVRNGGTLELRAGLNRNTGRDNDIDINVADGGTLVAAGYATDRSSLGLHVNLADGSTLQGYYGANTGITIAQALTLTGTSNTAEIEAADGKTLTLSGGISGTGGFTKAGTGTLVLSGNNSHTGGTLVSEGTLQAASANALGNGTLTLNADTTLTVESGTSANVVDVTVAGNATISNSGTLAFTGKGGINVAENTTITLEGNGIYDLSGMDMEEGTGTVEYTGGAEGTTLNGFAKAAGTIDFVDISASGSSIVYNGGASFTYKGGDGTFDSTTGQVEVQAEDYDYTIFYVNEKEDYVSNAKLSPVLDHIELASGTTIHVDENNTVDAGLILPQAGAAGYTIDVNSGSTMNIATTTDTSAITGEGTLYMEVPEVTTYDVSFKEGSPFTGTLVFNEATSIGNHNSYVVLDDTFQGTLELRGRMNGHNMNLGGATTLRLVGDRNSNITGIWDSGTAMHITQALEVTGGSRVELWSTNNQTTILDGTVNGGTDKVGHLSKVNNGNMNFNGAVALAEFITPGGTINFNAGANISTVSAKGTFNLNGAEAAYDLGDFQVPNNSDVVLTVGDVASATAKSVYVGDAAKLTLTLGTDMSIAAPADSQVATDGALYTMGAGKASLIKSASADAVKTLTVDKLDLANSGTGIELQNVNLVVNGVATVGVLTTDRTKDEATMTVGTGATLTLAGTVNWNSTDSLDRTDKVALVIDGGAVNVNGGVENTLDAVTLGAGGSLTLADGTATTIMGAVTLHEAITNEGDLTINGAIALDDIDDKWVETTISGYEGSVDTAHNGFISAGFTEVTFAAGGGTVALGEGVADAMTHKGHAGTVTDGVFSYEISEADHSTYYLSSTTEESLATAINVGGDDFHTVIMNAGTKLNATEAEGTVANLHINTAEGAAATLTAGTANFTNLIGEGEVDVADGATLNAANITVAQDTELTIGGEGTLGVTSLSGAGSAAIDAAVTGSDVSVSVANLSVGGTVSASNLTISGGSTASFDGAVQLTGNLTVSGGSTVNFNNDADMTFNKLAVSNNNTQVTFNGHVKVTGGDRTDFAYGATTTGLSVVFNDGYEYTGTNTYALVLGNGVTATLRGVSDMHDADFGFQGEATLILDENATMYVDRVFNTGTVTSNGAFVLKDGSKMYVKGDDLRSTSVTVQGGYLDVAQAAHINTLTLTAGTEGAQVNLKGAAEVATLTMAAGTTLNVAENGSLKVTGATTIAQAITSSGTVTFGQDISASGLTGGARYYFVDLAGNRVTDIENVNHYGAGLEDYITVVSGGSVTTGGHTVTQGMTVYTLESDGTAYDATSGRDVDYTSFFVKGIATSGEILAAAETWGTPVSSIEVSNNGVLTINAALTNVAITVKDAGKIVSGGIEPIAPETVKIEADSTATFDEAVAETGFTFTREEGVQVTNTATEGEAMTYSKDNAAAKVTADVLTVDSANDVTIANQLDVTTIENEAEDGASTLKLTHSSAAENVENVRATSGDIEFLNIAQEASIELKELTIGTAKTVSFNTSGVLDEAHEATVVIAASAPEAQDGGVLNVLNGATLNANLVMEAGSTLDVSYAQGSNGLIMGSSVTLKEGVLLQDSMHQEYPDINDFLFEYLSDNEYYSLYDSVEELYIQQGGTTQQVYELNFSDWRHFDLDASHIFTNLNENTYALVYNWNAENTGRVALVMIPEPTTGTLSLLALAALAARRRRR